MKQIKNIFLADDDIYDRELFQDALQELCTQSQLTCAEDGVELMTTLDETVPPPPYAIFLDLNMPGKNGYECLTEIKNTHKLKDIMVVIFSTTASQHAIEKTYSLGANYYISKPSSFALLKKAIETVLQLPLPQQNVQQSIDNYVLEFN